MEISDGVARPIPVGMFTCRIWAAWERFIHFLFTCMIRAVRRIPHGPWFTSAFITCIDFRQTCCSPCIILFAACYITIFHGIISTCLSNAWTSGVTASFLPGTRDCTSNALALFSFGFTKGWSLSRGRITLTGHSGLRTGSSKDTFTVHKHRYRKVTLNVIKHVKYH